MTEAPMRESDPIEEMAMRLAKAYDANVSPGEVGAVLALRTGNGSATRFWRALATESLSRSAGEGEAVAIDPRDGRALYADAVRAVSAYLEWCHYDETMWDAYGESGEGVNNAEARRKHAEAASESLAKADMTAAPFTRPPASSLTVEVLEDHLDYLCHLEALRYAAPKEREELAIALLARLSPESAGEGGAG